MHLFKMPAYPLWRIGLLAVAIALIAACSAPQPQWRVMALNSIVQLEKEGASEIRPEAFRSLQQTFEQADLLFLKDDEGELADQQYRMAYQKSVLLKSELAAYRSCIEHEAREAAIEEEILRQEEVRRLQEAEAEEAEKKKSEDLKNRKKPKGTSGNGITAREHNHLPTSYVVKRGETLPQIAARPEIYNDASLWQLIYRSNRDQVRDPYQLWPGQVLKIPRSYLK